MSEVTQWRVRCVCVAAPVILCLKKLELILYAVTGVRGGELEGLTGLRGRLTHKDRISG